MWLRHFTERTARRVLAMLASAAVLSACAGGPAPNVAPSAGSEQAPVVPARAQTLFEQAAASMAAGDFNEAELRFGEFLLQYPNYPGAYVNLAIIAAAGGDDLKAEANIGKALALDANHAPALNQLGMLRRRQGRFEDADNAYRMAVTASPRYALAHYNRAVLNELYLQRLEEALVSFERYQSLTGDDEQVTKWIADLKRRIGTNQRTANVTE